MRSFYGQSSESRKQHEEAEAARQERRLRIATKLRDEGIADKIAAATGIISFDYSGEDGTTLPVVAWDTIRDKQDTGLNPGGKIIGYRVKVGAETIRPTGTSGHLIPVIEKIYDGSEPTLLREEVIAAKDVAAVMACVAMIEPQTYTGQAPASS